MRKCANCGLEEPEILTVDRCSFPDCRREISLGEGTDKNIGVLCPNHLDIKTLHRDKELWLELSKDLDEKLTSVKR